MTAYQELLAAAETTDFAPKGRNEKKEVYLARLMKAIYKADKAAWDALSLDAQKWYTEAARRYNARLSIEDCPGYQEPEGQDNAGLTHAVRKVVLLHPDSSKQEILQLLVAEGWDFRHLQSNKTVDVVRSVTIATIKAAKAVGRWNDRPAVVEPEAVQV